MASAIDPTYPVAGNPQTANVRANFAAAKSEIETLQSGKADDAALAAHLIDVGNPHAVTAAQTGVEAGGLVKCTFDATRAPGPSDASIFGYAIGSRWIHPAVLSEWVCMDATPGAAVWVLTT